LRNAVHNYGFAYHPYRRLCMGKCPMCSDPDKDPHHQRKVRKAEFRRIMMLEMD